MKKKDVKQEIVNKTFSSLCFAIVIGGFIYLLNLGYVHLKTDIFMTDLKLLGVCAALISMFVIERSYKLDDDELALQGIEIFVLSLILIAIQLILTNSYPFILINSMIVLTIVFYYMFKVLIICLKTKRI